MIASRATVMDTIIDQKESQLTILLKVFLPVLSLPALSPTVLSLICSYTSLSVFPLTDIISLAGNFRPAYALPTGAPPCGGGVGFLTKLKRGSSKVRMIETKIARKAVITPFSRIPLAGTASAHAMKATVGANILHHGHSRALDGHTDRSTAALR